MWRGSFTIIVVLLCLAGYAAYEQFGKNDQVVQGEQTKSEAAMKEMIASNGIEIGKSAPDFELTEVRWNECKVIRFKRKESDFKLLGNVVWALSAEIPDMEAFYKRT